MIASKLIKSVFDGVPTNMLKIPTRFSSSNSFSRERIRDYKYIKTEKVGEKRNVALITLNRPKICNALGKQLELEVTDALSKFDSDRTIGAIVITGNEKVFASGGDISELVNQCSYAQVYQEKYSTGWDRIMTISKPVIAAVNGPALGGGCELAMLCDITYAGEKARFSLPEVKIGTLPGIGSYQRLTREIGKSKAMEMALSGSFISALEAEKCGLVSKVFPPDQVVAEAIKLGEKITANSQLIVSTAKDSVNAAYETTLQEGLRYEKKLFYGTLDLLSTNQRDPIK